jgi:hypothetical protein
MSYKDLQLQVHNFPEHLITCSTNSTKLSGPGAVPNRALMSFLSILNLATFA